MLIQRRGLSVNTTEPACADRLPSVNEGGTTMKPILLATDGSPTAAEAATRAIELARALGAPLVITTVWQVSYEPIGIFGPVLPDLDAVGSKEALELAERAATSAREAGVECETVVRRGSPAQEICSIADAADAQLIVLGSHGWGAMRRAIFGSVSTSVLHHAGRPVLVVPLSVMGDHAERDRVAENVEA
jgi:nucleotide-binding universal stress UspA family protein